MVSTWMCAFLCLCAGVLGLALGMVVTCLTVITKEQAGEEETEENEDERK